MSFIENIVNIFFLILLLFGRWGFFFGGGVREGNNAIFYLFM